MSSLFSSIIWIPCIFYFPLFTIFSVSIGQYPSLQGIPLGKDTPLSVVLWCLFVSRGRDLLHIQSKILCDSLHDSCSALMDTCYAQQNNQVIVKSSILGFSGRKGKKTQEASPLKKSQLYTAIVSWKAPKFLVAIASPVCVELLLAWAQGEVSLAARFIKQKLVGGARFMKQSLWVEPDS